jgi:hypothetical protein
MGIRPSEVDDVYQLPDLPVGPPFHFTEPRSFVTVSLEPRVASVLLNVRSTVSTTFIAAQGRIIGFCGSRTHAQSTQIGIPSMTMAGLVQQQRFSFAEGNSIGFLLAQGSPPYILPPIQRLATIALS